MTRADLIRYAVGGIAGTAVFIGSIWAIGAVAFALGIGD